MTSLVERKGLGTLLLIEKPRGRVQARRRELFPSFILQQPPSGLFTKDGAYVRPSGSASAQAVHYPPACDPQALLAPRREGLRCSADCRKSSFDARQRPSCPLDCRQVLGRHLCRPQEPRLCPTGMARPFWRWRRSQGRVVFIGGEGIVGVGGFVVIQEEEGYHGRPFPPSYCSPDVSLSSRRFNDRRYGRG